jgi:ankyrin repeat protein
MLIALAAVFLIFSSVQVSSTVAENGNGGKAVKVESPYFDAARTGDVGTILTELDAGHDLNVQNVDGWSPLHFAVDAYQPHAIALVCCHHIRFDFQIFHVGRSPTSLPRCFDEE